MKDFEKKFVKKLSLETISVHQENSLSLLMRKINKTGYVKSSYSYSGYFTNNLSRSVFACFVFFFIFASVRVWNTEGVDKKIDSFSFYSADVLEYEKNLTIGEDDDFMQLYTVTSSSTESVDNLLI